MKKGVFLILIISIVLTGCSLEKQEDIYSDNDELENKQIYLPEAKTDDSLILYNHWLFTLLSYDTKNKQIEEETNVDNYCQYSFNNKSSYYTTGYTPYSEYKIISVDGNKINTVLEMDSGQGIFPLATDGKKHFFVIEHRDLEYHTIVELDGESLIEYPKAMGLVVGGALLEKI